MEKMKDNLIKLLQERKKRTIEMKDKAIDKMITFITSAFGFVAALSWNNAVKNLFDKYYAVGEGISAMFLYALVVTALAVVIIVLIERISLNLKSEPIEPLKT